MLPHFSASIFLLSTLWSYISLLLGLANKQLTFSDMSESTNSPSPSSSHQLISLEIEGYKKFEKHITIPFQSGTHLIIGKNNSGKSTILQALTLWNFCVQYVKVNRPNLLFKEPNKQEKWSGQGVSMTLNQLAVLNIPNARHIWPDLKLEQLRTYTTRIKCNWKTKTDKTDLSLTLWIAYNSQNTVNINFSSNFKEHSILKDNLQNHVLTIAYLPYLSHVVVEEPFYQKGLINSMISQGRPGEVLRNIIHQIDSERWKKLEEIITKEFEEVNDLQRPEYKPEFERYLQIYRDRRPNNTERGKKQDQNQDIMVEGSGFLQWLSIFSYVLYADVDVILLDEPDAHMHPNMQANLYEKLIEHGEGKTIIIATHSSTMAYSAVEKEKAVITIYEENSETEIEEIVDENQLQKFLPKIDTKLSKLLKQLFTAKRVLVVEGSTDEQYLKKANEILECNALGEVEILQASSGSMTKFIKNLAQQNTNASNVQFSDTLKLLQNLQDNPGKKIAFVLDPEVTVTDNMRTAEENHPNQVKVTKLEKHESHIDNTNFNGIESVFSKNTLLHIHDQNNEKLLSTTGSRDARVIDRIKNKNKNTLADKICQDTNSEPFEPFRAILIGIKNFWESQSS